MFKLKLSWQQWSGPSRHATRWHEHTHQGKTHCSIYCPKTQYQPESKLQTSDRPEDRQSHPERGQTGSKQQARTVCMHQHVPAWDLPCMRRLQRLQHRSSGLWSCCPSAYGIPHWSAGGGQPAVREGGCRELQQTSNSKFLSNLSPAITRSSSEIGSYHCGEGGPIRWSHNSFHRGSHLCSPPHTQGTHGCSAGRGLPAWWAWCHCWWWRYWTSSVWKPEKKWLANITPQPVLVKKSWGSVELHSPFQPSSPGCSHYWRNDHALQGSHGGMSCGSNNNNMSSFRKLVTGEAVWTRLWRQSWWDLDLPV